MNQVESDLHFYFHACFFKLRDLFLPRKHILKEAQIKSGFRVVDYGCGPGSYLVPLAELVGKTGKVYAVDVHPLAIKKINAVISRKKLGNVSAIYSECKTGLPGNSIDVVLLYDVFHALDDSSRVLAELQRILKPGGFLSFQDHRMKDNEIMCELTKGGYFQLLKKNEKTYTFQKI